MKTRPIGLSAIALGVAALLSAGGDAQAAASAAVAQKAPPSASTVSPATASGPATVSSPSGSGPGVAAPDALKVAAAPQASAAPKTSATPSDAGAALQSAMEQKKYLFLAFYRPGDAKNVELMKTFEEAEKALGEKAIFYQANIQEQKEQQMVREYQVTRAPLPLTFVFASNGAFVNAFRGKAATKSELEGSFLSPKFAEAAKALQDRKIVLLCVQGKSTQHNAESLAAARATSQAKEARGMLAVVQVAPEDSGSNDLLRQFTVDATLKEATLFILVPPAILAGTIEGATTKEAVWQAVLKGVSACRSGGCGAGGCSPGGCSPRKSPW